jgi:hypothetical protein
MTYPLVCVYAREGADLRTRTSGKTFRHEGVTADSADARQPFWQ